jgi:hypothetical protein
MLVMAPNPRTFEAFWVVLLVDEPMGLEMVRLFVSHSSELHFETHVTHDVTIVPSQNQLQNFAFPRLFHRRRRCHHQSAQSNPPLFFGVSHRKDPREGYRSSIVRGLSRKFGILLDEDSPGGHDALTRPHFEHLDVACCKY